MEPFRLRENDGKAELMLLESWCDIDGVTAGFTTREAGNIALHVGDDPAAVIGNRKKVAGELDWRFAAWTCAEQVHGSDVRIVTKEDIGRGSTDRETAFPSTDALIANEPDILLAMFFADCVPLYFYDPVTGAMGLAHAGWKGTVAEIAIKTAQSMEKNFGAKPENMTAAIGPSIGSCCYEVDEAVLRHVRPLLNGLSEEDADAVARPTDNGRAMLDLKLLNRHLIVKAGILPSRIELSSWCTGCRTDVLFSHRNENGSTGRMMSWLGRKSR